MASVFDLKHKMIKNYTNKGINILNIAYPYSIGKKNVVMIFIRYIKSRHGQRYIGLTFGNP